MTPHQTRCGTLSTRTMMPLTVMRTVPLQLPACLPTCLPSHALGAAQPSMNIAGGLLGYALLKVTLTASTALLERMPWLPASIAAPLTAQEVNFVQVREH